MVRKHTGQTDWQTIQMHSDVKPSGDLVALKAAEAMIGPVKFAQEYCGEILGN